MHLSRRRTRPPPPPRRHPRSGASPARTPCTNSAPPAAAPQQAPGGHRRASGGRTPRTKSIHRDACHLFRAGRCGTRQSNQDSTQTKKTMHAKHADGPCPAWSFTAATAAPLPGEPRQCGSPCPICVFCVHLPASALNPCLLRRAPHAAADGPWTLRDRQNPMHQFSPLVRQDKTATGRQNPIHHEQLPNRRCPPSRPARNETMVRLARDRSADNSVDKGR
jgi:hypothetical protein